MSGYDLYLHKGVPCGFLANYRGKVYKLNLSEPKKTIKAIFFLCVFCVFIVVSGLLLGLSRLGYHIRMAQQ